MGGSHKNECGVCIGHPTLYECIVVLFRFCSVKFPYLGNIAVSCIIFFTKPRERACVLTPGNKYLLVHDYWTRLVGLRPVREFLFRINRTYEVEF